MTKRRPHVGLEEGSLRRTWGLLPRAPVVAGLLRLCSCLDLPGALPFSTHGRVLGDWETGLLPREGYQSFCVSPGRTWEGGEGPHPLVRGPCSSLLLALAQRTGWALEWALLGL